jgi:hypothetical protein
MAFPSPMGLRVLSTPGTPTYQRAAGFYFVGVRIPSLWTLSPVVRHIEYCRHYTWETGQPVHVESHAGRGGTSWMLEAAGTQYIISVYLRETLHSSVRTFITFKFQRDSFSSPGSRHSLEFGRPFQRSDSLRTSSACERPEFPSPTLASQHLAEGALLLWGHLHIEDLAPHDRRRG